MSNNYQRSNNSFFTNTDPNIGPYLYPWSDGLHIQLMINTRTPSPPTRVKSPPIRIISPEPKKIIKNKVHKTYTRYKIKGMSLKKLEYFLKIVKKSVNIFDIKTIQSTRGYGVPHCYFSVNHSEIDEFCKLRLPKKIIVTMC